MPKSASKSAKSNASSRKASAKSASQPRRIAVEAPKPTRKTGLYVVGLVLVALGIFLVACVCGGNTGKLGVPLSHFLLGLFGKGGYVFPFLMILAGAMVLLYPDFTLPTGLYVTLGLFFWMILCLMSLLGTQQPVQALADYGFFGFARLAYQQGLAQELCGGFFAGLLLYPMLAFLGISGSVIFCFLVIGIMAVLWGFSFANTSRKVVDRVGDAVDTRRQRRSRAGSLYMGDVVTQPERNAKSMDLELLSEDLFRRQQEEPREELREESLCTEPLAPEEEPAMEPVDVLSETPVMEEKPAEKAPEKPRQKVAPQQIVMENIQVDEPELDENGYRIPPLTLLEQGKDNGHDGDTAIRARKLEDTLHSFGVKANVVGVNCGPAITQFEVQPAPGVKSSSIVSLSNDIALSLAAPSIRIEAPIPGKSLIGVEVPNTKTQMVKLRDVIENPEFDRNSSSLAFGLGRDIVGKTVIADLGKMPHLLVAGATGSGKSVCINSMLISLLYRSSPQDVRLILIDPKVVEMNVYNDIPHLLIPVVTDPQKAAGALKWAVKEMEDRYQRFAQMKTRDIVRYNQLVAEDPGLHMPYIVIVIDEMADLMMVAARDVEDSVCRLAQKARAAGMHLVLATQRPSVDVITGVIKANIPSRIAFAVSSQVDSRTILDSAGAERLLGKGDMLYFPNGASRPLRVQGAHVGDEEVERVVDFIREGFGEEAVAYDEEVLNRVENYTIEQEDTQMADDEEGRPLDPLLREAVDVLLDQGQASISMVQRRLRVGYARAARLVDQMELLGIVGPSVGSKPREIIKTRAEIDELLNEEDA